MLATMAPRPMMGAPRPPYSTREWVSRPKTSVPSQCSAEIGASRCAGSIATGSTVPSSGANRASSTTVAKIAKATAAGPRVSCALNCPGPLGDGAVFGAVAGIGRLKKSVFMQSSISDAGIQHGVEHIDEQGDQDVAEGKKQDQALNHGVVARQHRLDDQAAEPGQIEHRLRHHYAGDQRGDPDADDRDDRHRRIA